MKQISEETLTNIADAIRIKRGTSAVIHGADFASEIMKIDRMKRMNALNIPQTNYGLVAAYAACSYEIARYNYQNENDGAHLFDYDTSNSPLSSNHNVRNASGQCFIDCSTLVGLAMRGVFWDNSPYTAHTAAGASWNPSTELSGMVADWGINGLDAQPAGAFSSVLTGTSSIRTSADLAEYLYRTGTVIYDSQLEGEVMDDSTATALCKRLAAGDVVFWSTYPNATDRKRFRGITHTAMICPETKQFVEATGKVKSVVRRQHFINNANTHTNYEGVSETCPRYRHMVLVIRPNYGLPPKPTTPKGINILQYPWSWGIWSKNTANGIDRTCTGIDTIKLVGKSEEPKNWNLRGDPNDPTDKIMLTAGTYQMHLEASGDSFPKSAGLALQFRDEHGNDFETPVRAYHGNDATITVENDGLYTIALHVNGSTTFDCSIKVSLKRTA